MCPLAAMPPLPNMLRNCNMKKSEGDSTFKTVSCKCNKLIFDCSFGSSYTAPFRTQKGDIKTGLSTGTCFHHKRVQYCLSLKVVICKNHKQGAGIYLENRGGFTDTQNVQMHAEMPISTSASTQKH